MTVKIGLIGAGRIGKIHAESIVNRIPDAELVAVSDVSREAAEWVGRTFRVPHVDTDHQAMLQMSDLDAVAICSATDTHARIITEAAQAGKHVACEKPIALTLDDGRAMIEACEKARVRLFIAHVLRFVPEYASARAVVAIGASGP